MKKRGGAPGSSQPPRGPRRLDKEDHELWSHTVRTLEPLRRAKPRVRHTEPGADAGTGPPARPPPVSRPEPEAPEPSRRQASAQSPSAPPATFDRRKARKIASGGMQIEAKLDLHGLHQAEAHRRLRSFLLSAHARGVRMVLVITGKGSGTVDPAGLGTEGVGRGIIRRNVPLWLGEPDLRAIVIGTAPAHARHGGDGALYVHLRKPRGP